MDNKDQIVINTLFWDIRGYKTGALTLEQLLLAVYDKGFDAGCICGCLDEDEDG